MKLIRNLLACFVSLVCVLGCLSASASNARARSPKPPIPSALRLERTNLAEGPIVVKLRLADGEEVPVRLDTGAEVTFLDESLAPKLPPRLGTTNICPPSGETESLDIYPAPKLYVGDTRLLTGPRVFTQHSRHIAEKGLLGMDCLRHYCIQFDFAAGKLIFLDPEDLNPKELGTPFPLKSGWGGITYFEGNLFGQGKMRFLCDTGWDGICDAMLDSKVFKRLAKEKPNAVNPLDLVFPGGAASGDILPNLNICSQTYTDLHFYSGDLSALRVKGFICMRFLARHRVTLNFPKRLMYLKCVTGAPLAEASSALHNEPGQADRRPLFCFCRRVSEADSVGHNAAATHLGCYDTTRIPLSFP